MASEALQPAFEALQQEEIACFRRFTGGRVMPCGDGFTGFSLILPHRSALLSDDPLMLAPFQVMNRYVRGILTGLKNFGVNVFYPGRDFLTVRQKSVGWVSFTTEAGGALLFEGILSVNRDFSILPYFLDKVDPGGVLPSQFLTPDTTTSLSQEAGKEIAVSPVADLLRHGYATQFSHNVEQRELTSTEKEVVGEIVAKEFATSSRLYGCTLRPDLPCYGMSSTQLGTFTVCFSLTPELLLREVKFSGDFITNAEALAALEQELERCPAERQAIWQAVDRVFTRPQNFLLGIGPLETIPETIIKGLPQTDPR
jgi:lipoate-protein ligase A